MEAPHIMSDQLSTSSAVGTGDGAARSSINLVESSQTIPSSVELDPGVSPIAGPVDVPKSVPSEFENKLRTTSLSSSAVDTQVETTLHTKSEDVFASASHRTQDKSSDSFSSDSAMDIVPMGTEVREMVSGHQESSSAILPTMENTEVEDEPEDDDDDDDEDDEDDDEDDEEDEEEEDEDDDEQDNGCESGSDEEKNRRLENPSTNIRDELENALEGSLDFDGSFYFNKTYPDAPNPVLRLANIGNIGLPLTDREAKVVISQCNQAPFGKGERTVVDTSVRDTWEMDASQIGFDNYAWKSYMDRVVQEVCSALGVNFGVSKPRCELYKLLLYETGSHFLPHQDTEKANGMFATIIVVLPSHFSGGTAHLSHGGLSKVIDCSTTSLAQTTVLSWYTDVTHEIKPVTSGYRFALSYNLIHTTQALRPALPSTHAAVDKLRHIMLSWKQNAKTENRNGPSKLLYLLKHQYSQAGLKGSALKGIDAHKFALLNVLAEELDFHLGLASVECHVTGAAEDDGPRRGWGYDDSDNESEVSMLEVYERDMSITGLVGLDGRPIRKQLGFDENDDKETIPRCLRDTVESGPHDEQEYEGYMGNGAGSLDRWYRRTVLVIWPDSRHFEVVYGDGNYQYALEELSKRENSKPTRKERKLTNYVLGAAANQLLSKAETVKRVCSNACAWEDVTLWHRAIGICEGDQNLKMITKNGLFKAIETFGFEAVRPTMEAILCKDSSNVARYDFLNEMSKRVENQPDDEVLSTWIADHQWKFMQTLKKPSKKEANFLVKIAEENGGVLFLRDIIVPQVRKIGDAGFLLDLGVHLLSKKSGLASSTEEHTLIDTIVTDLLSCSIRKIDFYTPVARSPPQPLHGYRSGRQPEATPGPELAQAYVQACRLTANQSLLDVIFEALIFIPSNLTPDQIAKRMTLVILPLIPFLRDMFQAPQTTRPSMLVLLCQTMVTQWSNSQISSPSKRDLSSLLDAAIMAESPLLISTNLLPKLKKTTCEERVLREFTEEIQARRQEFIFPGDSGVTTSTILTEMTDYIFRKAAINSAHSAIEYLEFCSTIENPASYHVVIRRLLHPVGPVTPHYIKQLLVPFIPELRRFLLKHHIALTAEPFATTFKAIMVAWLKTFLGPKPSDGKAAKALASVRSLSCNCAQCVQVVNFLTVGAQPSLRLERIGAPKRKHVETSLQKFCGTAAHWTMINTTPQGLQITKADSILKPAKWRASQQEAKAILNSISNDNEELRNIFDADYPTLMQRLNGDNVELPATPLPSNSKPLGLKATNTQVTAPSAKTSTSFSNVAQTPARKRKMPIDDTDVIDLTSP